MPAFYNSLKRQIDKKSKTKEEFQEITANWSIQGWLTDPEVATALAYIETAFPETVA